MGSIPSISGFDFEDVRHDAARLGIKREDIATMVEKAISTKWHSLPYYRYIQHVEVISSRWSPHGSWLYHDRTIIINLYRQQDRADVQATIFHEVSHAWDSYNDIVYDCPDWNRKDIVQYYAHSKAELRALRFSAIVGKRERELLERVERWMQSQ